MASLLNQRQPQYVAPAQLQPYTVLLKDGETTATIYPITSISQLPLRLVEFLCDEFNMEIERGDTFPLFDTLHMEAFQTYWLGGFAGVMLIGDSSIIEDRGHWEKECLGTFYIKPNHPGRCSHICTGGFLVNAGIRGKGIGRTLMECYLDWAPKIGYTYSVFNLVFDTNILAKRLCDGLKFKRIGRIKGAGILKGIEHAVDALMYGKELVSPEEDEDVGDLRFDRIRYYLETGQYPTRCDRQEKSRLRSSAAHYKVSGGKLWLRDKQVISDPEQQLQIALHIHMQSHSGINKTTSQITEKYHWTRIKDTVAQAVRSCVACREVQKTKVKPEDIMLHSTTPPGGTSGPPNARDHLGDTTTHPHHHNQRHNSHDPHHHHHSHDPQTGILHPLSLDQLTQSTMLVDTSLHRNSMTSLGTINSIEGMVKDDSERRAHRSESDDILVNAMAVAGHEPAAEHEQSESGQQSHGHTLESANNPSHHTHNSHSHGHQLPHGHVDSNSHAHSHIHRSASPSSPHQDHHSNSIFYSYQNTDSESYQSTDQIAVDPTVEHAFADHVNNGEEIAIARALIQANESVEENQTYFR